MAAAIVWLIASIAATPSLSPDTHALIGLLPAVLLALAGIGFLATWVAFHLNRLMGLDGFEDDGSER